MSNDIVPKSIGNVIPFSDLSKHDASNDQDESSYETGNGKKPGGSAWAAKWMLDDRGNPLNNLSNVLVALRDFPSLAAALCYNEMRQEAFLMKPLPGDSMQPHNSKPRPVSDQDVTRLQEFLQLSGLSRIGKDVLHHAVDLRARECAVHPVRDYLSSLKWDGAKRVEMFFSKYFGAKQTPYLAGVSTMFLVAMVARVQEPGCQFDYVVVLEGKQGIGKSTACRILGGEYFSDSLPDLSAGKDLSQHIAGKWLIEVAELAAMKKADMDRLKAVVTRREEQYRPSYGRKQVRQPRQCVFVGTTNQSSYLRDETGARRFWPVKVSTIDTDVLRADRDQLFAEALLLYFDNVAFHPDAKFEREHIRPEQDARYEGDPWEDTIREYLASTKPEKVYLSDLLHQPLGLEAKSRSRRQLNRVAAVLERLGWVRLAKDSKSVPWGPPPL